MGQNGNWSQLIEGEFGSELNEKAIIISDHGASRLAVLHETENIWSMATSGEHSGRCCPVNELNSKPNAAIEENGFWVLANYDRFKGGRKANVISGTFEVLIALITSLPTNPLPFSWMISQAFRSASTSMLKRTLILL